MGNDDVGSADGCGRFDVRVLYSLLLDLSTYQPIHTSTAVSPFDPTPPSLPLDAVVELPTEPTALAKRATRSKETE